MDFTKELEQMNVQNAIKGEVKSKLADILESCTKDKLSVIASNCNLTGRSKMKKPELTAALYEQVLSENNFKDTLLLTRVKELELFKQLFNTPYAQNAVLAPGTYRFLMDRGLIFSFWDGDKLSYVVPEEVKEAYHKMDTESFLKTRDRYQLVLQYFDAAANLYGVCKHEKLLDIFNAQNDEKLNETGLMQIYSFLSRRQQLFYLDQGYLVSSYFEDDNEDELEELLERIKNKPCYVPDKRELLNYADSGYYEQTPELARLKAFIMQNLCKDAELAETIVDDIQLACSMEEPFEEIMFEFERRNIHIKKMELLNVLAALINDVYNNTRLWSNCGHTPFEMQKSFGRPVHGQAQTSKLRVLSQQRIANKIGRNEPCPCGSGKKYKKCCGK